MVRLSIIRHAPEKDPSRRPDFVLLHGLASNARMWDGVGAALARAGFASIAVDLRGHGQSPKPPVEDGYGFADVVADVLELLEAEGLTGEHRPTVAGQSWGGNLVIELGAMYPESVRAVMAVDGGVIRLVDRFPIWEDCATTLAPPELIGTPAERMRAWMIAAHADWPAEGIEGSLANFERRPDGTIAPWLTRDRHLAVLRGLWEHNPVERFALLRLPTTIALADSGETSWTKDKRAGVSACVDASPVPIEVEWFVGADHDLHAQYPVETAESLVRLHERAQSASPFVPISVHPS